MQLTPIQIENGIADKNKKLTTLNEKIVKLNDALAEAEREYRVALAVKIHELRDAKVQVTLIPDLSRGDEHIADLKYTRDTFEGRLNATKSEIYDVRSALDSYRSLLAWARTQWENT